MRSFQSTNFVLILNIVLASHTVLGSPYVVGSHHLAREFSLLGHNVVHISTSIGPLHFFRIWDSVVRLRIIQWWAGGVSHSWSGAQSYVPFDWSYLGRSANFGKRIHRRSHLGIARHLRSLGMESVDLLLVDQPAFCGLEEVIGPRHFVYRATDLYSTFTSGGGVVVQERSLAKSADFLVGTSAPVVAYLQSLAPTKRVLLIENGVEVRRFREPVTAPKEYETIPPPRAVYAGAFDERFGFDLIDQLAKEVPSLSIVLIGPSTNAVRRHVGDYTNVYWLGGRTYESLAGYLQHATVGLLPLSSHAGNTGRSPMKLYEYAASGLPVISTATPELKRRNLGFVELASDGEGFVEKVRLLAFDNAEREIRRGYIGAAIEEREWTGIARKMLSQIESVRGGIRG